MFHKDLAKFSYLKNWNLLTIAWRREFTDWALQHMKTDPDFARKIIFSDEAHFRSMALPINKITEFGEMIILNQ